MSQSPVTADHAGRTDESQWYLRVFLEDGEVPIDNLACERAIKPLGVGRRNWLVIDTVHGAEDSAIIYSIVETPKPTA